MQKRKVKTIFIASIFLMSYVTGRSQDLGLFEKKIYTSNSDTLPYRLLLPSNYDASKKYPLVFFMHGAGERGNDNEKQLVHGAKLFLSDEVRSKYPAIIVFPQCPANSFWSNLDFKTTQDGKRVFVFNDNKEPTIAMKLAQELLHQLINTYPVEKKQIYVAGLSMGGMGTFEIARRNPGLFAAAIPICGGGATTTAQDLKTTHWWIFHGAKDEVVPLKYSEEMVKALEEVKAPVKFTVYPEATHNSWDATFAEPQLLSWLFSKHK